MAQVVGPLLTEARHRPLSRAARRIPSLPLLDPWLAADPWTGLAQISALYFAAILVGFRCEFAETYLMQRTGQLAMFDLRRELMAASAAAGYFLL